MTARARRPRTPSAGGVVLSEDALLARVLDTAMLYGWRVHHGRPCRTAKGWRTAITGNPGFPDLVLARDGVVLLRELKSDTGRVEPEQATWLAAVGPLGGVWRPRDWDVIVAELSTPRRTG